MWLVAEQRVELLICGHRHVGPSRSVHRPEAHGRHRGYAAKTAPRPPSAAFPAWRER
jgi:hypothetical protein